MVKRVLILCVEFSDLAATEGVKRGFTGTFCRVKPRKTAEQ